MVEYKDYIDRLKEGGEEPDYARMYSRIQSRISSRPKMRLALAGALALLFISAAFYLNSALQPQSEELFMSYIFEHESIDGPLLSYVFE